MKKVFTIILLSMAFISHAQEIERSVIGTFGFSDAKITCTAGEVVIYNDSLLYINNKSIYHGFIQPTVNGFVSVEEIIKYNISIFPNPASTTIYIKHDYTNVKSMLITDVNGKQLGKYSSQTKSIPISQLARGMYWLSIEKNNTVIRKKFIKL